MGNEIKMDRLIIPVYINEKIGTVVLLAQEQFQNPVFMRIGEGQKFFGQEGVIFCFSMAIK